MLFFFTLFLIVQNAITFKFGFRPHFRPQIAPFESFVSNYKKKTPVALMAALFFAFQGPIVTTAADLSLELETYVEETESYNLKVKREPKNLMTSLKKSLTVKRPIAPLQNLEKELADARERVLTLKAYLDEAERDLFTKNWANLQIYIYTFADQENAFATLIDNLFPNNDSLDKAAREALSFEAQVKIRVRVSPNFSQTLFLTLAFSLTFS